MHPEGQGNAETTARARRLALFACVSTGALLLGLELMGRLALGFSSGFGPALGFGFQDGVESFPGRPTRVVRVLLPPRMGGQAAPGVDPEALKIPLHLASAEVGHTAFAFGGSTTAGRQCSAKASSWSSELAALVPGLAILNFGVPGGESDRSLTRLRMELRQSQSDFPLLAGIQREEIYRAMSSASREKLARSAPDLVFWANWINERNTIFEGHRVLFDRRALPPKYRRQYAKNRVILFLHRLHITLRSRSAAWLFFTRWTQSRRGEPVLTEWQGEDPDQPYDAVREQEIAGSIAQTMDNLRSAHELASAAGSQLVVVRLPMSWPLFQANSGAEHTQLTRRWNRLLFAQVEAYATEQGLVLLDPHQWFEERGSRLEDYCDGVHLNLSGHRRVAQALYQEGRSAGLF